jgi:hypothetical protein
VEIPEVKKNVAAKVRPHKGGTEQAWLASLSAEQRKSIPRPYLSPGELVEPDARRVQKQASDRAHEARRSRARVKTSSRKRTAKPTGEQSWEALLTGPEYTGVFEPVTAADRYMALELRAIANRVLGDGNLPRSARASSGRSDSRRASCSSCGLRRGEPMANRGGVAAQTAS